MASVRLERVYKRFGDTEVVSGVDLDIADGEFAVLAGPSGCGKSTVLRAIAGLESISAGDLYIGGEQVTQLAAPDRDVALVFQSYALYPRLTVRDNIGFGLRLRKLPAGEIADRVEMAADIVGLRHLLDRSPKQLSSGQRQRVAMGRAIARQPAVFLFDEPLSNMEGRLRDQVQTEIARLHKRLRTTVVYVTHDQVEAMALGSFVAVMDRGTVQQSGAPLELYRNPANLFVAGFIGEPEMNFFDVTLISRHGRAMIAGRGFQLPLPDRLRDRAGDDDRALVLGIRPEHMSQASAGDDTIAARVGVIDRDDGGVHAICDVDGHPLTARLAGDSAARVGDVVHLAVDLAAVHVFDKHSGASLAAA